mmetsp:Transcript_34380/g.79361  ORF Transcript_34380/g.79361 Transcript_34380/m.79361 type:complete len:87 (+) Transcript_34380:127-387(+)
MSSEDENKAPPASEVLANCLLSQYRFCMAGVGIGVAHGIRSKKGAMPMVVGGLLGSVADLFYGYSVACKNQVEDYRNEQQATDSKK